MDLQTMLNNAFAAGRQEELKNSPQLLLGEMILKLEAISDKSKPLYIDIRDLRPMGVDSWRGSYCELAIQTEMIGSHNTDEVEKEYPEYGMTIWKTAPIGKENPTVGEWIEVLKQAIGKTFTGYKGGDFLMGKNTPVWLAEYGDASFVLDEKEINEETWENYKEVFFIDVREENDRVYLVTKIEED